MIFAHCILPALPVKPIRLLKVSAKNRFCTERRIHKGRPGDEPVSVSALKAAETNSALCVISVAAC